MENNSADSGPHERVRYLMLISPEELFKLTDDGELSDATFHMISRVWGDGMDLVNESDAEHTIVLVSMTNGILSNGGFEALFSGEFRADPDFSACLKAFRSIGAENAWALLQKTLQMVGDGDAAARSKRFFEHPRDIRKQLDSNWFNLASELNQCLAKYIRANRNVLDASWLRAKRLNSME